MSHPNTDLQGHVVAEVRLMTPKEMESLGWHEDPPLALVLENGTLLFPSRDVEGNGPGVFVMHGDLKRLDELVGQTITGEGAMTPQELRRHGWAEDEIDGTPCALTFDAASCAIYPASDHELNSPGSLFGHLPDGSDVTWQAPPEIR